MAPAFLRNSCEAGRGNSQGWALQRGGHPSRSAPSAFHHTQWISPLRRSPGKLGFCHSQLNTALAQKTASNHIPTAGYLHLSRLLAATDTSQLGVLMHKRLGTLACLKHFAICKTHLRSLRKPGWPRGQAPGSRLSGQGSPPSSTLPRLISAQKPRQLQQLLAAEPKAGNNGTSWRATGLSSSI